MSKRPRQDDGANLVVISGPSGVGKSTIVHGLLERLKSHVRFSVSATTRAPRRGESDGVDYHFVDRAEFERRIAAGEFIEHAEVFGNLYGTPVEELRQADRMNLALLLEIDVQGGLQIRRQFPGALLILLVPPTLEALHRRLCGRGTDSPETIARRYAQAEAELDMARQCGSYDVEIVNDNLEQALERSETLIKERWRSWHDRKSQE